VVVVVVVEVVIMIMVVVVIALAVAVTISNVLHVISVVFIFTFPQLYWYCTGCHS